MQDIINGCMDPKYNKLYHYICWLTLSSIITYEIRLEVDYPFVGKKQPYIFKTDDDVFIIFFRLIFSLLFFFFKKKKIQYLILVGIRLCWYKEY